MKKLWKLTKEMKDSGSDWVRIGQLEDKDGRETFYWITYYFVFKPYLCYIYSDLQIFFS